MTRDEGLSTNSLPTGMQYYISPTDYNPSLYLIRKRNGDGPVVMELAGLFTSPSRAQKVITRHVNSIWDNFEQNKKAK